jgi:hypothetical protein
MVVLKTNEIKVNPNNPRIIKDFNFKRLVQSVTDFPEMLNLRPIVVNKDMVILGGNMRFKACIEAGIKEVPVIIADNLTPEQENVIICKKHNSKGGDLHIPDYNATIGQQDNSILVYPAWKNLHGVTPIIPIFENGYRNSLIFYPLKAFIGID